MRSFDVSAYNGEQLPHGEITGFYQHEDTSSEQQIPQWWGDALARIAFLVELPDDWDSYGAKAVDVTVAFHAVQILQQIADPEIPAPAVVPTVRGHLQFEWHTRGVDLEVEVVSPVKILMAYEDSVSGTSWERELDYNLTPLRDTLKVLVSRVQGPYLQA